MAERVGFEPTVGVSHVRFQDGSLKPLGHLSTNDFRLSISDCRLSWKIEGLAAQSPNLPTFPEVRHD